MDSEPRKATDVLLDIEVKIDVILNILRNQDLNIKIISNKLNDLIKNMPISNIEQIKEQFQEDFKEITISAEDAIPIEQSPKGFRRTSRSETYSNNITEPKIIQPEIIVPEQVITQKIKSNKNNANAIPVIQRVVDANGKSIFMADVEIINSDNGEKVNKTRTNGAGKWQASLVTGNYKVILSKKEPLTKQKIEIIQDILVDGNTAPLELKMIILK
jgi:hypothetical protein